MKFNQYFYIFSLEKELTETQKKTLHDLNKQIARVKDQKLAPDTPKKDLPLGMPAAYWIALKAYDQSATAKRLKQPILVLQGERDYQVTTADYDRWKEALSSRPDATFKLYPRLNHHFMAGEGTPTPAEYDTPGNVSEQVVVDIADWIKRTSNVRTRS